MRLLPKNSVGWIAFQFERWLLRRFDTISTISTKMLDKLKEKGTRDSQLKYLPNWVDTSKIRPANSSDHLRSRLGIHKDAIIALYSGSMNEKSGLDLIVRIAQMLSTNPKIAFVLCGDGPARRRIEHSTVQCENITFLPLQPLEQLNELLNMADIHLLPQQQSAADLVMPSKLAAILSAGGAVVGAANDGTEIDTVLRQASGARCPPDDAALWAKKIEELGNSLNERQRMGYQARQYAILHCDKQKILGRLAQQLLQIGRD
jgi:colanic acid biosynthesis glycosyl transferase WcaI